MRFDKVFLFLMKRFKEIGIDGEYLDQLQRELNRFRVRYDHIMYLSSGLVIDSEYKEFGFKE